jgi:hypothetical protein
MATKRVLTFRGLVLIVAVFVVSAYAAIRSIPEFGRHCVVTPSGRLMADLQTLHSQVQLYSIQHNGQLPGTAEGVSFEEAMTEKTNADGSLNPVGSCGPYLERIAPNAFNGLDTVEVDGTVGGGDYGWHYNSRTGEIHADTDEHTQR